MTIDTTRITALLVVMVCVALTSAHLNRRPAAPPGCKPSPPPPSSLWPAAH
ncbi:hypothetical protein [Nocardioides astragali]|uniref:Uncharacterized protein n=1 Tax=Nocardioides astragali TaxID=1776736 RepID=A0ABW2N056_9ACTN|nr:hypothetical protein [Nocardioides astragali]